LEGISYISKKVVWKGYHIYQRRLFGKDNIYTCISKTKMVVSTTLYQSGLFRRDYAISKWVVSKELCYIKEDVSRRLDYALSI